MFADLTGKQDAKIILAYAYSVGKRKGIVCSKPSKDRLRRILAGCKSHMGHSIRKEWSPKAEREGRWSCSTGIKIARTNT